MKNQLFIIMCVVFSFVPIFSLYAQGDMQQHNTIVLVDGSSYMKTNWGGSSKLTVFRNALSDTLAELNKSPAWGFNMGIRVYGDKSARSIKDCLDARQGSKLDWFEPVVIRSVVEGISPKGMACLAFGMGTTREDFPVSGKNTQNYLVCIVSARDECSKDEKETIEWLTKDKGLAATYIIGLDVPASQCEYLSGIFKTVAGRFINITSPSQLTGTMNLVLNQYCRGQTEPASIDAGVGSSSEPKTAPGLTPKPVEIK
ncbi:hypothetical protein JXA80_14460 [bacterium]|nr:hypothetical protein [candidate division CSSED10-310 bacterium]